MSVAAASWLIRAAGAVQLAIAGANVVLPFKLRVHEKLVPLPPILRQIFYSHWFYIGFVLAFFGALCLLFPAELLSGRAMDRFILGFLACFWGLKLFLHLFLTDNDFRRQNRSADILMLVAVGFLAAVFCLGAWGSFR